MYALFNKGVATFLGQFIAVSFKIMQKLGSWRQLRWALSRCHQVVLVREGAPCIAAHDMFVMKMHQRPAKTRILELQGKVIRKKERKNRTWLDKHVNSYKYFPYACKKINLNNTCSMFIFTPADFLKMHEFSILWNHHVRKLHGEEPIAGYICSW